MQIASQSTFPAWKQMVWNRTTALSFEAVRSFVLIAEKTRRDQSIVLYTLLEAARNRESIKTFDDVVPKDHVWMTSLYDEAIALLLGPIFYRMKIGSSMTSGVAVPREGALDSFNYDLQTHREMLRLILQGAR